VNVKNLTDNIEILHFSKEKNPGYITIRRTLYHFDKISTMPTGLLNPVPTGFAMISKQYFQKIGINFEEAP
jgi:hypothetical protein